MTERKRYYAPKTPQWIGDHADGPGHYFIVRDRERDAEDRNSVAFVAGFFWYHQAQRERDRLNRRNSRPT